MSITQAQLIEENKRLQAALAEALERETGPAKSSASSRARRQPSSR